MAFVDKARIFIKAGAGGKGCESYYRDRYMKHPKPDGGDGGSGGDVVVVADGHLQTLLDYRFKQHYKADKGGHGSSQGKTGRGGADCVLRVPVGTIIHDEENGLLIRDLTQHNESVIVAKGGRGGIGNMGRRSVIPPTPAEEKTISFELKIIADVGIVGFPNAGKSTLINKVTRVRSKIGNYPFTTRQPILGIVRGEDFNFTLADLPGLIEGAADGKGLGHQFLKHAERTKILLHMVDMAGSEGRDPLADYEQINHELEAYSDELSFKHKIVVANKMDEATAWDNFKRFQERYSDPVYAISALEGEGLDSVMDRLRDILWQESFQKV